MTRIPLTKYGELLSSAPEAQFVADPTTAQTQPAIEIDLFCRNGQHPHVTLQNQINAAANAAVLYRSKEVFSGDSVLSAFDVEAGNTSAGAGDRARWRFAFHTGPYSHSLFCIAVLRAPTSGYTSNTHGRLDIADGGGSIISSATLDYGNDPTNGTGTAIWNSHRVVMRYLDGISGSTDYYGTFYDVDNGLLQCATVFDLQSLTENFSGYLAQNVSINTPVLNLHRQLPVTINNALWQHGGAHVFNWSVNDGTAPITTVSATATNIIDTTSTAVSSSTPGYTLDMTGKDRISQTSGVPCVMKAFLKCSSALQTASVYLKDSGGTTLATCSTSSTTATWVSTTFNLPATVAKYDLMFACSGGSIASLYAVSVYEKG